jgi:hypothetical protein
MTLLSPTDLDLHARRLLVDEAEWRDRLDQLADVRRVLSANPIASAVVVALIDEHGNPTASR